MQSDHRRRKQAWKQLTYREYKGNTTTNWLGAIQVGLLAQEQLFLAVCLPRSDCGAVQVDRNGFPGRQARFDNVIIDGNGRLGQGSTQSDGRWLVGTDHCDDCQGW